MATTRAAVLGVSSFVNVRGGDTYRVDVDRHGQRVSLDLLLPLVGGRYLGPIFQVCSLAFFICGAALGLLRPQDGQVRFVSVLLMSVGFTALHEALGTPRHSSSDGSDPLISLCRRSTCSLPR